MPGGMETIADGHATPKQMTDAIGSGVTLSAARHQHLFQPRSGRIRKFPRNTAGLDLRCRSADGHPPNVRAGERHRTRSCSPPDRAFRGGPKSRRPRRSRSACQPSERSDVTSPTTDAGRRNAELALTLNDDRRHEIGKLPRGRFGIYLWSRQVMSDGADAE